MHLDFSLVNGMKEFTNIHEGGLAEMTQKERREI